MKNTGGINMNNYDSSRDTTWSGFVGELQWGQLPISQLLPYHPCITTYLPANRRIAGVNHQ